MDSPRLESLQMHFDFKFKNLIEMKFEDFFQEASIRRRIAIDALLKGGKAESIIDRNYFVSNLDYIEEYVNNFEGLYELIKGNKGLIDNFTLAEIK